ncbi:signal peptide peptidase-domain-containing protein [Entophlyctis helioformis]|nr:signal peptide peptidase-domain-containing protein [Entophlyctis helioformis]
MLQGLVVLLLPLLLLPMAAVVHAADPLVVLVLPSGRRFAAQPLFNGSSEFISGKTHPLAALVAPAVEPSDLCGRLSAPNSPASDLPDILRSLDMPPAFLLDLAATHQASNNASVCSMPDRIRNIRTATGSASRSGPSAGLNVVVIRNTPGTADYLADQERLYPELSNVASKTLVVLVSKSVFAALQSAQSSSSWSSPALDPRVPASAAWPLLTLFRPDPPPLVDVSVIALFALAGFSLWSATSWGAWTHPLVTSIRKRKGVAPPPEEEEEVSETVTASSALSYVLLSSAALVLIYMLPNILVHAMLLAFFTSGVGSISICAMALVNYSRLPLPAFFWRPVFAQPPHTHADLVEQSPVDPAQEDTAIQSRNSVALETQDASNIESDGPLLWADVAMLGCSGSFMLWWAWIRNSDIAWLPQNVIGLCLIASMLRFVNLPNLKRFTSDGKSIMEAVALGAGTSESMPMLFRVPRFADDFGGYTMLGYGDIVVPGLLVHLARALDLAHAVAHGAIALPAKAARLHPASTASTGGSDSVANNRHGLAEVEPLLSDGSSHARRTTDEGQCDQLHDRSRRHTPSSSSSPSPVPPAMQVQDADSSNYPFLNAAPPRYYLISLVGYSVGLVAAFVAVHWMKMGQPALLYLVPSTLVPIAVHAFRRGELAAVWDRLDTLDLSTHKSE